MGGAAGTNSRRVQSVPLTAGAEDKEDGIHRPALIDAGPMTPQGMQFPCREQGHDAHPQHIWDAPAVIRTRGEGTRWDGANWGHGSLSASVGGEARTPGDSIS